MENGKVWTKEYAFNEQQEISHSLQREILNSFCYDRLTYWKSLNDQGKGVTAMRHKNISAKTSISTAIENNISTIISILKTMRWVTYNIENRSFNDD